MCGSFPAKRKAEGHMPYFRGEEHLNDWLAQQGRTRGPGSDPLEHAVVMWMRRLPDEHRPEGGVDRRVEPISPAEIEYRVRYSRQNDEDGPYGPWWVFACRQHDGGWIVAPLDVPVEDPPGRLYVVEDKKGGRIYWTDLV